ncbi:MAG: DUF2089 family protein [Pseudomonadota bacterium]
MSGLNLQTPCPACQKLMRPHGLQCSCGVRVDGPVQVNEFANLDQGQLQFLRMFVLMEGRITDLEKALGISYPTVKSRIRELKTALRLHEEATEQKQARISDMLDELEAGDVSTDEVIERLRDE